VSATWTNLAYLAAAVLFIFGIKGMTHPRTAVRGNLTSASGMLLAVAVTIPGLSQEALMVVGGALLLGTGIGIVLSQWVAMTAMPQLVAIFNGFGGGASVLVSSASLLGAVTALGGEFGEVPETAVTLGVQELTAIAASGLIGTVTFWGSLVAFAKLQGVKGFEDSVALPGHQFVNALLVLTALTLGVLVVLQPENALFFAGLVGVATLLGFLLVLPIGGADMPVVVALLNSYSGLAAAATGFVLSNTMLIVAGSLVGASGLILTGIMCRAMNRSLTNVLFGGIDAGGATSTADEVYEGKIKSTSPTEVAMLLEDVQRVVIVPGYGMAVAQAQHAVRDLYNYLEETFDAKVEFAIHPVAGRMPGHMNVLLAEVDIPYDRLIEMDAINPTMESVDVAIVLGANDVVNPDARKSDSPIAGMPIINVDKARTVVVVKRSLSPGFAGIPNPLFAHDNTLMMFGDGKKMMTELLSELKEL